VASGNLVCTAASWASMPGLAVVVLVVVACFDLQAIAIKIMANGAMIAFFIFFGLYIVRVNELKKGYRIYLKKFSANNNRDGNGNVE